MKKTITRVACAGLFLIAALVLGRKMFTEDRITSNDQVHTRVADSVIAGDQDRNTSNTGNSVKLADIDDSIGSLSADSVLFAGGDFISEAEDQPGSNYYVGAAYDTGDSEKITGRPDHKGSHSTHTSPGNGAVTHPAGSTPGNTGHFYAGNHGNGAGDHGRGGNGAGGGSAGGKGSNDGERTGNSPGEGGGVSPGRENTDRAREDKNDSGRDSKSGGEGQGKQGDPGNLPEGGSNPEYFDAPPGHELDDLLQPPGRESGHRDYEETGKGVGASENSGISTVPEPASNLLIGLGGMMLLWLRRRGNRN